jgi:hypothetical protein
MDVEVRDSNRLTERVLYRPRCRVLWDESFPHAVELQFENGDHSTSWTIDSDLLCTISSNDRPAWGNVIPPEARRDDTKIIMFAFKGINEDTDDMYSRWIGFNGKDLSNIKLMIDADVSKCVANSSALELTPFHQYIDEGINSLLV